MYSSANTSIVQFLKIVLEYDEYFLNVLEYEYEYVVIKQNYVLEYEYEYLQKDSSTNANT